MAKDPDQGNGWPVSRRAFLKGVGVGGAAAAVGGSSARHPAEAAPEAPPGVKRHPGGGAKLTLKINGESRVVEAPPSETLLEVLRERLGLTGAKEVCGRGACGACTVLADGRAVNSCMMLAADAADLDIVTAEGLAPDGRLDPLQQAYAEHDACQCGYCIPGFVVRSRAFLDEHPNPGRDEIKAGLAGNICRCAAYVKIFDAVEAAAKGGAA